MRIELQPDLQDPLVFAQMLGAVLQKSGTPLVRIVGLATDTREIKAGDLFLALKGEHADGNSYIPQAIKAGACGVLTEQKGLSLPENTWYFQCECVQDALLRAAGVWRKICQAHVIAVTGSTGKTTTKEAIACVLGDAPHNTGNYNSMIGMPLSVFSLPKSEFWVCELGINHPGEMTKMATALCPDIGVITNVGCAHIGNFAGYGELLKEKLSLGKGLGDTGKMILPFSLKNVGFSVPSGHLFYVGEDRNTDFTVENIVADACGMRCDLHYANGEITNLSWPMPGVVGSSVLGISAAVGVLCGRTAEQIRAGLQKAALAPLHASVYPEGNMLFFEDCYNASPEACLAAVESLSYLAPDRVRVAVLGDMLELGEYSEALHEMIGEAVCRSGVSYLFTYGTWADRIAFGAKEAGMSPRRIFSFSLEERELLVQSVVRQVPRDAALLFKASRALKMEQIVQQIRRLL